jgi:hypothetical protein
METGVEVVLALPNAKTARHNAIGTSIRSATPALIHQVSNTARRMPVTEWKHFGSFIKLL